MILVTGGSGLLGAELITQLLAAGKKVRALYHNTPLPDFDSENFETFQCDILDVIGLQEAMQGIEQVYHCAAIVTFNHKRKKTLFKINIEGTANIVNAALETGVKKLVHVSSVAALGRIKENETIDETMNWTEETNKSNYGKSKYLSELEVWRGIGEGLEAVIVNPVIILGAGNWSNGSSQLFKTAFDEFPWYSKGSNGFVDVRDVATAMIQLMESNVSAQRFILSAVNKTYQEVLNIMAASFHKKPPYKEVTPFLANLIWRFEKIKSFISKKEPLITKETAATALAMVTYDNSKLNKFLPEFSYKPIGETITDTCDLLQQKFNNKLR